MTGLILGKFYPLHRGHTALVAFAQKQCDQLFVLVCASETETLDGQIRLNWLLEEFAGNEKIHPVLLNYSEDELPNTSISSREVSKIWANKIATVLPKIDRFFSSEPYGDFMSEFLSCQHIPFDFNRKLHPASGSEIRSNPFKNWDFLTDAAKPYFVQKICICGTESTGKSTLTEKLAAHYKTTFVPEMAREIISETEKCTEEHLQQIAALQAQTIIEKSKTANKLLFVDTDIYTTRSYSQFLFGKPMPVAPWIEKANSFSLHIYLEPDAIYVQDGTRLGKIRRDALDHFHKAALSGNGILFEPISGNWDQRFTKSVAIIDKLFLR